MSKQYEKLSSNQIHWIFQKVEDYVQKYNDKKLSEMDDEDWEEITKEAIHFGDVSARADRFAISLILNALEYLQQSKKAELPSI